LDSEVLKYLNKYSNDGKAINWRPEDTVTSAIVIPAIGEYNNIRILLRSLIDNDREYFNNSLFVFVINNLPSSEPDIKEDNRRSLQLLNNIIYNNPVDDFEKEIIESGLKAGYIDAATLGNEFPLKDGGVGLARKTGMDAVLRIFNYKDGKEKLLICLDADCTVKENYLTEIHTVFNKKKIHAASIYFEHPFTTVQQNNLAIICYEIFLRYYILGLRYAGSSYAFHTIGSSMVCSHEIYIKTEGMNKKKAAEDFYFLEKISKNTRIFNINSTTVYPSGRKSWRVPFGTGQRITRYYAKTHDEYSLYNPETFEILKEWIRVFHSEDIKEPEQYLSLAAKINNDLHDFLVLQNFEQDMTRILNSSKSGEQVRKQQLKWFDGFRTLKLVHYLRDTSFPNLFMFDALDNMFVKNEIRMPEREKEPHTTCIPDIKIQSEYLRILRVLDKNCGI
jgi:hypothetical protein